MLSPRFGTVGEMARFATREGIFQFSLEEKQVHFEINLQAASEADLKISSRLLLLARIVKEQNRILNKEGSALWLLIEFEVARARESRSGIDRTVVKIAFLSNLGSR